MEKNWYSYKNKDGATIFYYNSDSGEHRWADSFELLQCAKLKPEEVPLLKMCKNGHKMPKRNEKSYKSTGTETEEYFLVKNTAIKSVRDVSINTVVRNDVSSVNDDGGAEPVSHFCASPSRSLFATEQPFSNTNEIVKQEYVDPNRESLVGNLFAMELSSVLSPEPADESKGDLCNICGKTSSGEPGNVLPSAVKHEGSLATSDFMQVPTVSSDAQATHGEDEPVKVKTECEDEDIPKGCYLGLTVGKEGRICVKTEPEDEHFEQEIEMNEIRIKQEVCEDDDDGDGGNDDGGGGGEIDDGDDDRDDPTFSILDLLPDHPANNVSGSNSDKKPIQCETCERIFKKRSHLKRHMLIHMNSKPYPCEICGKCFREASSLTKHIRIHTGEKPYHCSICKKKFSQLQNLNKHRNVHTGNKPHKCKVCGKAFSQHSHLGRHKLIHTGEKPYQCTECGKSYRTSSHLVRHHKSSNH